MKEYTEDDTYRALMRPSIRSMHDMLRNHFGMSDAYHIELHKLRAFLKLHNWKVSEYITALKEMRDD